jgi:hypothetical protein
MASLARKRHQSGESLAPERESGAPFFETKGLGVAMKAAIPRSQPTEGFICRASEGPKEASGRRRTTLEWEGEVQPVRQNPNG